MEFFKKRGVALVVLMLAIAGAVFIGQSRKDGFIAKKPTELLDVQYQDWICDEAGLLNGQTEQLIRDYNDSWNSKYYAITAVASIDHLTGWDAEDYAANLGEKWGLGRNDMILLLVKDGDWQVYCGDNVGYTMTDTQQNQLRQAIETTYYSGDFDSAVTAFFRQADVFELLTELGKSGEKPWDYIILDPPAFTKSGATVENARRGYREINRRAMQILPRGGYLATCSCSHFMTDTLFRAMLADAARDASVQLRQIEARQQSPDHPILWGVPETDYLKFYLFQIV